jgi:neutral ceramidase
MPVFTIEPADGYKGYQATREQHTLGGYETWRGRSSCLEVDAAAKITADVLELVAELRSTVSSEAIP